MEDSSLKEGRISLTAEAAEIAMGKIFLLFSAHSAFSAVNFLAFLFLGSVRFQECHHFGMALCLSHAQSRLVVVCLGIDIRALIE
jgi:hypothetical protein